MGRGGGGRGGAGFDTLSSAASSPRRGTGANRFQGGRGPPPPLLPSQLVCVFVLDRTIDRDKGWSRFSSCSTRFRFFLRVGCIKHVFESFIVLQFDVTNRLRDQRLHNVLVKVECR